MRVPEISGYELSEQLSNTTSSVLIAPGGWPTMFLH